MRRLAALVATGVLFATLLAWSVPAPVDQPEPLHVLVIMTDDQRGDTLEYLPAVMSMGGTRFTQAFATTSLCCPARASFLTGQYAHNHGVWDNDDPYGWQAFEDEQASTLAVWLDEAGYDTAQFGKYFNDFPNSHATPPGWDSFEPQSSYYWKGVYNTDAVARNAIRFIRKSDAPFFVWASLRPPHGQHKGPPPIAEEDQPCPELQPHRPPSYELEGQLAATIDEFRKFQICSLASVDRAVARLLAAVPANTLVIFVSDNGYLWGEHAVKGKGDWWDESARVPLVIRHPDHDAGINSSLVGLIDLAPTILDAVGLPLVGKDIDGVSLMPLLSGNEDSLRSEILIEHLTGLALRTDEGLYVATEDDQLYLLDTDPYQIDDVSDDSLYANRIEQLRQALDRLKDCSLDC